MDLTSEMDQLLAFDPPVGGINPKTEKRDSGMGEENLRPLRVDQQRNSTNLAMMAAFQSHRST
jgi:hypothetical protein